MWVHLTLALTFILMSPILGPSFASAMPLSKDWVQRPNPAFAYFAQNTAKNEYISLANELQDSALNFSNLKPDEISSVITLLRRATLEPLGLKNWTAQTLKRETLGSFDYLKIEGTYENQQKNLVSFQERIWLKNKRFIQLSYMTIADTPSLKTTDVDLLFKVLTKGIK